MSAMDYYDVQAMIRDGNFATTGDVREACHELRSDLHASLSDLREGGAELRAELAALAERVAALEESLADAALPGRRRISKGQRDLIAKLSDDQGFVAPETAGISSDEAAELILSLQAGTFNPDEWDLPF